MRPPAGLGNPRMRRGGWRSILPNCRTCCAAREAPSRCALNVKSQKQWRRSARRALIPVERSILAAPRASSLEPQGVCLRVGLFPLDPAGRAITPQ
jgi:hypothetical protein